MKDMLKLYNSQLEDDQNTKDNDELSLEDVQNVVGGRRTTRN